MFLIDAGYFHLQNVTFFACESEAETLLQASLFPATPKHPQLAFTFDLLDWLEALMLECQVSAQDFSAAIGMLTDTQLMMMVIALCNCIYLDIVICRYVF